MADWREHQHNFGSVALEIMQMGKQDLNIMPLSRYNEDRAVFNEVLQVHADSPIVMEYRRLEAETKSVWKRCLAEAHSQCIEQYADHVGRQREQTKRARRMMLLEGLQHLADVQIGNVHRSGQIATEQAQAGIYVFQ